MDENIKNTVSLVDDGSLWLPGSYSTMSSLVDNQFYFILIISIVFSLAIFIVTILFSYKYKRSKSNQVAKRQITHNVKLELIWTIIPFFIVMGIFYWGFTDYLKLTTPPPDAEEILVTAKQYAWWFDYPDSGKGSEHLVVPVGRAVKLRMTSVDVLHSFYVPNFRIKRDLVPNRYSHVWFEATKTGTYQIFCTEYCGVNHSTMLAKLIVLSDDDYREWKKDVTSDEDLTLPELGKKVYVKQACNTCHSIDGSRIIGPTWKGAYGKERELTTGEKVLYDDNYIRESIVYPGKKIAKGYNNIMPAYVGRSALSELEMNAIIEYIKELK